MITTIEPDAKRNYRTIQADGQNARLTELDHAELVEGFKHHGAILFRGFPIDASELNAFTGSFCSSFVNNRSRGRKTLSADGRTQTVNLGVQPFPLHSELSREPWRPDIAWFACSTPPVSGGETLVCDGLAIVSALSECTRRLLLANQLEHKIEATAAEVCNWLGVRNPDSDELKQLEDQSPYTFSIADGHYQKTFHTPVLQKPMFSEQLAFANFLLFARYFLNIRSFPTFANEVEISDEICAELKQVSDELTVAHKWQVYDLLMLDNTRFMHGRNAVEDPNQRLILTQFGYASFAPLDDEALRAQPWRKPLH